MPCYRFLKSLAKIYIDRHFRFFVIFLFYNYIVSEDEQSPPTHVVIIRNGHIFTFDLYGTKKLLTPPEILKKLEEIVKRNDQSPGIGLGALTVLPRDEWAEVSQKKGCIGDNSLTGFRYVIIYVKLINRMKLI